MIRQVDRSNGEPGWLVDEFKHRDMTRPVFYLGDLVIGDIEGYIHVIDAFTGKILNRQQMGSDNFYGAPVVEGNVIYAYNKDGTLTAFRYTE